MDIIIYGPDPQENELKAFKAISDHLGGGPISTLLNKICTVSPTEENFNIMPPFEVILADGLDLPLRLIGALSEIQKYRITSKRPDILVVYCTTVNPLALID